jgi:hypothetical protein
MSTIQRENIKPTGSATYCPEDDKIRLYVGRVPREEYDFLRSEGWTSTPKQTCDFVAVWSVERENTALQYSGGILEDEDQSPAERAADRAERFSEYRDKRTGEALDKAETYEAGPKLIGHQSEALAERKARALDRVADRACNSWDKAEYWQRRTAGVISHALHVAAPGVRMGRIKMLEAEIRRVEAKYTPQDEKVHTWEGVPTVICGQGRDKHGVAVSNLERIKAVYSRYLNHITLRLAYENQMLEAQGGRAASVEMVPGGWLGSQQIIKVNKSPATGRVVSVAVKVPRVEGWAYKIANVPGTDYALMTIETERLKKEVYTAPTAEELEAFEAFKKAEKKQKAETLPKGPALINPTDEDAAKLQEIWNTKRRAEWQKREYSKYGPDFVPATLCHITQERYSELSKGSYSHAETVEVCAAGNVKSGHWNAGDYNKSIGPALCKVRVYKGDNGKQVLVITDKPKKALPAEVLTITATIEQASA